MAVRSSTRRRIAYLLFLALMALCAVAPSNRASGVLAGLSGPVKAIVAPVSRFTSFVGGVLRPTTRRGQIDVVSDDRFAEMERELRALLRENFVLKQQISALEGRPAYGTSAMPRKIVARRIGADPGAGTIDVQAGVQDGVIVGTVASAIERPTQLIGAVSRTHQLMSSVHLLTDEHFRYSGLDLIQGVIVPEAGVASESELAALPRCQLRPSGSGVLVAPLVGIDEADRLRIGDEVLLDDDAWPASAQMLLLGLVERIEDTSEPLHKRVVVRPTLDLERLGKVVLRLPNEGETAPGSGAGQ